MKRIILLLIFVIVAVSLQAFFRDFSENPADLGNRESGDVILPLFYFNGGMANNNLSMNDLGMFEAGHELTNSEKDLLTSSDLNFTGFGCLNILSFGFKNWEFTMKSHVTGYIGNFDKEFMELTFYGNDEGYYETSAMSDSYAYQFIKGSFDWAYPHNLNLSIIPAARISNKDSGKFVLKMEGVLNYLREMDIYLGARLNWYNALGYGEVADSHQEFISDEDSLYTYNHMHYIYSDPDAISGGGNSTLGFGLGLKAALPDGWFYLNLDDLGAKLQYSDLLHSEYNNFHLDYLDFIDEEHEAIDESDTIEGEPYEEDVYVNLKPTVSVGAEYNLGRGFAVMAKYLSCDYMIDGIFLGTTYRPLQWLPIKLTYGNGDVDTYNIKFGFDTESFELLFGMTNYNGLFNGAKGYGGDFGIKFKF